MSTKYNKHVLINVRQTEYGQKFNKLKQKSLLKVSGVKKREQDSYMPKILTTEYKNTQQSWRITKRSKN